VTNKSTSPIVATTYDASYTYGGSRPHAPTEIDETAPQGNKSTVFQRTLGYDDDGNAEVAHAMQEWKQEREWYRSEHGLEAGSGPLGIPQLRDPIAELENVHVEPGLGHDYPEIDIALMVGTSGVGTVGRSALTRGSEEMAAALQGRAAELNAARGAWLSKNGTTAAMLARNNLTGEVSTFIATEAATMEKTMLLRSGEKFVAGVGHAEETILQSLGKDWTVLAGGTSRNVCLWSGGCAWQLGKAGLGLGGPVFRGNNLKTGYRLFWRQ
jgi:hypothetical protein